ncbi:biotin-dependent carboxyltransferase family protein [Yimella sp. cx-573]|nr:biotin-dependent carboxyltransferase family protein [Yimella sp. cx-573]
MTSAIEVLSVGGLITLQDLGRPGHAHLGVPTGGAVDRHSLHSANRLVGNGIGAPALEFMPAPVEVRALVDAVMALTGAPAAAAVGSRPAPHAEPFAVRAGEIVRIAPAVMGVWTYLALRGGFDAPRLFDSASSSPTSALGPAPVQPGDVLEAGELIAGEPLVGFAEPTAWRFPVEAEIVLGPRDDWFTQESVALLTSTTWTMSSDLDRVGGRLDGPALQRNRSDELPSEGMVRGSVQVSANGQLIVFFADHPPTGGYPVVGVVADEHVDRIAQCRPGEQVRFRIAQPRAAS